MDVAAPGRMAPLTPTLAPRPAMPTAAVPQPVQPATPVAPASMVLPVREAPELPDESTVPKTQSTASVASTAKPELRSQTPHKTVAIELPKTAKQSSATPIAAIIITLFVMIALAALAVVVYLKSQ
jgi:hypothetical protein